MALGAGYKGRCGVGIESSAWNTAAAPSELVPLISEGIKETEDWAPNEVLKSKVGRKEDAITGIKTAGPLTVQGNYQETDMLMALLFGGGAGSPTGSGPYVHTVSLSEDIDRSLSIHFEKDVFVHSVPGCMINTASLIIEPNDVRWEFDIVGGGPIDRSTTHRATLTGLSDPAKPRLLFSDMTFRIGEISAALIAGDERGPQSMTVAFENVLAIEHRGTDQGLIILEPKRSGRRVITISFEIPRYTADEWHGWMEDQELLQADIEFVSGNYEFKLEFPTLLVKECEAVIGGPEIMPVPIVLQAYRNNGNSYITEVEECVATITNDRDSAIWT